jgi:hypothetical protein
MSIQRSLFKQRRWPGPRGGLFALACLAGLLHGAGCWQTGNLLAQGKKPSGGAKPKKPAVPESLASKKPSKERTQQDLQGAGIGTYKSRNFLLHTDLGKDAAEELLDRLEAMIVLVGKYYRKPLTGVIDMYVVGDVRKWPEGAIAPEALRYVENGGGLTMAQTLSDGNQFISRAAVYASADRGTPQHEAVHAYCVHTFGRTGPTWYAEGMAEVGQYWRANDSSVNAHDEVIRYLRASEPKKLTEIVDGRDLSGDSWQNYAWRWALCHLLANNTNYADRFQPLGVGFLTGQQVSFERTYGDMAQEITFEYEWFLKHLERGLRVDLCSWDWRAKFKSVNTSAVTTCKIAANRGWQPSRLSVTKGTQYEFAASGAWGPDQESALVSADGEEGGRCRLVAVLMTQEGRDYQLGEPFALGAQGAFTAPAKGDLYLRCEDHWTKLADNRGTVTVRLKVQGKGAPLVPAKPSVRDSNCGAASTDAHSP